MIYTGKRGNIIYQYITFCKVLDQQIKKYGYTRKAVSETIRICSDKKVLTEYLKEREKELMDIMTVLFDQDEVTRSLIESKENTARKATKLDDIKSIMSNLKLNLQQALDAMNIPMTERDYYIHQIEDKKEKG